MRNPYQLGIAPIIIAAAVTGFIKLYQGARKDQVPDYPIKKQDTLTRLNHAVNAELPLPPTSVANAEELLILAENQRRAKSLLSGASNQTVVMLYDERIAALKNYIASHAGAIPEAIIDRSDPVAALVPAATSMLPQTTTAIKPAEAAAPPETKKTSPLLLYGGIGVLLFLLLKK